MILSQKSLTCNSYRHENGKNAEVVVYRYGFVRSANSNASPNVTVTVSSGSNPNRTY